MGPENEVTPPVEDEVTPPVEDEVTPPVEDEVTPPVEDEQVGAPETYADFEIGEGMTAADEDISAFQTMAKDLNLTQEQAQSLVGFQSQMMQKIHQQSQEAQEKILTEWHDDLVNDPEFGGDNLDATMDGANQVLRDFGSQELIDDLTNTGFAGNTRLSRMLARINKALGEDPSVGGSHQSNDLTPEEKMYGKNGKS